MPRKFIEPTAERRQANVIAGRMEADSRRKSSRNRRIWLARAAQHDKAGETEIAGNIRARVAEYDAHGWEH